MFQIQNDLQWAAVCKRFDLCLQKAKAGTEGQTASQNKHDNATLDLEHFRFKLHCDFPPNSSLGKFTLAHAASTLMDCVSRVLSRADRHSDSRCDSEIRQRSYI